MSLTSQPPRRDLYEIEQTAPEAVFLCPTEELDPTPQDQESVTTGWRNPAQDRLDAWKEKWELTR